MTRVKVLHQGIDREWRVSRLQLCLSVMRKPKDSLRRVEQTQKKILERLDEGNKRFEELERSVGISGERIKDAAS